MRRLSRRLLGGFRKGDERNSRTSSSLLDEVAASEQQEVRWHAAQMLPRLALGGPEREAAVVVLEGYLSGKSRIVQTNAMQALADFAQQDSRLCTRIVPLLEEAAGSAAMRARGRKLLVTLCPEDEA